MSVAYLVDPNNQFMTKSGTINVGGHIRVYLAATDDAAVTYKDFNGTVNPHDIILDDNGRAVIIADNAVAYRIEVYDRYNMLQWTQTPVWCMAAGGGVSTVKVQSSDGTVVVTKTTEGGTVVYDLSTQVEKEPAPYATASFNVEGVYATGPNFVALPWTQFGGDLERQDNSFLMPYDAIADVDCDVVVTYDQSLPRSSIFVRMEVSYGGEDFALPTRELDMSQDCPSVHFSFKVPVHQNDILTYTIYYQSDENVSCGVDARSWVNLEVNNLSDYAGGNNYNVLINKPSINGVELIGDKSGSELNLQDKLTEGDYIHIDSANVISVSGLQPSGNYVYGSSFSSYSADVSSSISSISSTVSGLTGTYIEQSASGMFAPSGNYQSALTFGYDSNNKISSIDGSGIGGQYSGIYPVVVDNTAETIAVDNLGMEVDDTMTAYASGGNMVIGVRSGLYAFDSAMSSKLDSSAFSAVSGTFLTAVPSEYATELYVDSAVSSKLDVTASSLFITSLPADLATTGDVASAVSGKLDNSASGTWYPLTGNPSGFLTAHQSLAEYATKQYVDSSVSGKLDSTAYNSAQFILTSQSGVFQPSGYYQPSGEYLSATESSNYYPTSNPSGFISSVDLSNYATTAYVDSSVSGKLDATASSQFITSTAGLATTADISGFAYESAVSAWTAKQDTLTFGYDGSYNISSINGSSIAGGGGSVVFDGTSNRISSIDGSALQASVLSSNKITIGISSDPGMFLSGSNGTAYYKANEMIINRSGYGEQVKFNLGSAGSHVYGSASGQRGAFISMFNDYHSAFLGAKSGDVGKIEIDGISAGSADIQSWNDTYDTFHNNSATWGGVTAKMDSSAVQSAYASASATQATAQGVLYILIPDGV